MSILSPHRRMLVVTSLSLTPAMLTDPVLPSTKTSSPSRKSEMSSESTMGTPAMTAPVATMVSAFSLMMALGWFPCFFRSRRVYDPTVLPLPLGNMNTLSLIDVPALPVATDSSPVFESTPPRKLKASLRTTALPSPSPAEMERPFIASPNRAAFRPNRRRPSGSTARAGNCRPCRSWWRCTCRPLRSA